MFGSVMEFEMFKQTVGLFGRESGIQGGGTVGGQIIQDHPNAVGLWIKFLDQQSHTLGKIRDGALRSDFDMAIADGWFKEHKQVTGTVALILGVIALDLTRVGEQWLTRFGNQ